MLGVSSAVDPPRHNFWQTLRLFWSAGRIQNWRNAIFSDPNNPNQGVETCYNLICLSPDSHRYWTKARFALKPIQLSEDKKRLDVEFHWLPKYNRSEMDILTSPQSPEVSNSRPLIGLLHMATRQELYSGTKISFTTDNSVTRSLPHFALLEMQWILHRVTAMSAAAEVYDDFDNNGDDDDDAMMVQAWDSYEDGWDSYEEESPSTKDHDISMTQSFPASSLPHPSPSSLPRSNIRSDSIPLRPAENSNIKMIDSPQGQ
jgi:hypothetical protein